MTASCRPTAAGLLIASLVMLATCGQQSDADALAAAKANIAKRNNAAAVVQLKGLLQRNPKSGEARFLMGQALLDQGLPSAARLELQKASELKYNDNLVAPLLARALLSTGQAKTVVADFAAKTLSNPKAQAELYTALSLAYGGLGNVIEMSVHLDKALKLVPPLPWALRTKARLEAANGNLQQALKLVDQATASDPASGDGWMLRGAILATAKQDPVLVLDSFKKGLQDQKTEVAAHLAIVSLHLGAGRRREAGEQFDALQKSHPQSAYTAYAKAQIAFQDKDYAKAKEALQALLNDFPNSPQLLYFVGVVDKQRGSLLSAAAELGKAVQLAPDMQDARKALVETFLQGGQAQQALTVLRPLIEVDRPEPDALTLSAGAHLQLGLIQKAEALYQQAAKVKPDDVRIRTSLALTDMARGNFDAAYGKLQAIAAADPGVTADMALIAARLRRKEFTLVLADLDRLEKKDPQQATASYLRGVAQRNRRDFQAARAAFEDVLKRHPDYFAAVSNLSEIDVLEQRPDAAKERMQAFVKRVPQVGAAHVALADILARQGAKPDVIIATLNDAIRSNPTDPMPRIALLAILLDVKDFKQALSSAQLALAALPEDPDVLYAVGRAQANAGDDQQAISTLSKLISLQPKSPLPHLRLAELYLRRRDDAAAALSSRRAFDAAPESAEVQRNLIMLMQRSGNASSALGAAQELQKRQPQKASGFLFEGDIHSLQKRWPQAEAAYRQALTKEVKDDRAPISVYLTLISAGKAADAERFATEWLKDHPRDVAFQNRRGESAMAKDDFLLAERRFMDVLAMDPKHVSALNNLAWLLARRNSKDALIYAERAAAVLPDDAAVQDTLALALAAAGQIEKAIAAQQRSLALQPNSHEFKLSLAKLYLKAGDKEKARTELDALAAMGAKFKGQAEVTALRRTLP